MDKLIVVSGKTDEMRRWRERARMVSKSLVGLHGLSSNNADTEYRRKSRFVKKRVSSFRHEVFEVSMRYLGEDG